MTKFKVGDRVRYTGKSGIYFDPQKVGLSGTVTAVELTAVGVELDGGTTVAAFHDNIEHALTLTLGKFYRTSAGDVAGPVSQGDIGFEAVVNGKVRAFDGAGGSVFGGDDIVEEWVPKVGERVVLGDGAGMAAETGATATVTAEFDGTFITVEWVRDGKSCRQAHGKYYLDQFEPLPVAAPAQPAPLLPVALQIEAGRYYKTRDGRKVGPMRDDWRMEEVHHYHVTEGILTGNLWSATGSGYSGQERDTDLIAEWVDEPASAPIAAQVDAIAEEYGPVVREPRPWDRYSERAENNDHKPTQDVTISIGLDTGTLHEELDELIAKLKKIKKLQRAVGLAA